jgi:hypothetical protein
VRFCRRNRFGQKLSTKCIRGAYDRNGLRVVFDHDLQPARTRAKSEAKSLAASLSET